MKNEKYKNRKPKSIYDESDPTPIEIPMESRRPETIEEKIRKVLVQDLSQKYERYGVESYEEAEDFDVKDDFETDEVLSGYEVKEMVEEFPVGLEESLPLPKQEESEPEQAPREPAPESDKEEEKSLEEGQIEIRFSDGSKKIIDKDQIRR